MLCSAVTPTLAPLAAIIARLKGAKLIVQAHGIEAWPQPSWVRRVALEAADLVLTVLATREQ